MSITPNNPADFTPTMGNYTELKPFRFWCQKVLPLVYDDSLSYYELLCKVVDFLNKTMEDVETLNGDVTDLHNAYVELQTYVNEYFSTLDVQEEINNKLDEMAESGALNELIDPLLPDLISEWLSEHIGPTTPAIDDTLSVRGAGADAKATGIRLNNTIKTTGKTYGNTSGTVAEGEKFGNILVNEMSLVWIRSIKNYTDVDDSVKNKLPDSGFAICIVYCPYMHQTPKTLLETYNCFVSLYIRPSNTVVNCFYNSDNQMLLLANINNVKVDNNLTLSGVPADAETVGNWFRTQLPKITNSLKANNHTYGNNAGTVAEGEKFGNILINEISLVWIRSIKNYTDVDDSVKSKLPESGFVVCVTYSPYVYSTDKTLSEGINTFVTLFVRPDNIVINCYYDLSTNKLVLVNIKIDKTLTQSDVPADSKTVGNKLINTVKTYGTTYGNNSGTVAEGEKFGNILINEISLVWIRSIRNYTDVDDSVKSKLPESGFVVCVTYSPYVYQSNKNLSQVTNAFVTLFIRPRNTTINCYYNLASNKLELVSTNSCVVDKTLTLSDVPADSKTVGDLVKGLTIPYSELLAFQRICCIGDSTMNGVCDQYPSGTNHDLGYSWVTHLKKTKGLRIDNYSIAGTSAVSWYHSEDGLARYQSLNKKAQLALIGIGINNYQESGIGTIEDVSSNESYTFYGAYSKILRELHTSNNLMQIICFTIATSNSAKNTAIKEICNLDEFKGYCTVCDLYTDYRASYEWYANNYTITTIHPIEIGYASMSELLFTAISKTIRDNKEKFYNIIDIPYESLNTPDILPVGY